MAKLRFGLRRTAWLVAALAVVLVAGCDGAQNSGMVPPDAATTQGQAIRDLYNIVFVVAAVIFLIVEALIIFAVIRYRRRPGDTELPAQTHGNNLLEIIWTIIPTAIVAILFLVSFQTLNTVQAKEPDPAVKIDVIGYQWQWQFVYTDHVVEGTDKPITINGLPGKPAEMVVPVNETVHLTLKSRDVIHAFYVPAFLYKLDVVPVPAGGKLNGFDFKADRLGTYRGQCAEFCGLQHDAMVFNVRIVTREEYDAWIAEKSVPPPATPAPTPGPSGGPGGGATGQPVTLKIAAENTAYDVATLDAPANAPITIDFDNKDVGILHNVSIHKGEPAGEQVYLGEIFEGAGTRTYLVGPLAAGTYSFVCTVHANMVGTLTVK